MFNYSNPYYNNLLNQFQGYKILPIPRIEEAENIFPDFQGNPLFFYDQTKNEVYVKQRDGKSGSIQTIKYVLSNEPLKQVKQSDNTKQYGDEISALKHELASLKEMLSPKKKVEKEDE
jgi:hypothetical protein